MIVTQTRMASGTGGNGVAHVLKMDENELVEVLDGDEEMLLMMDQTAKKTRGKGGKYGVRHFTISPDQEVGEDFFERMMDIINEEYDLSDREFFAVRHTKMRADGSKEPHFHLLVSEQNLSGDVMDAEFNYQKNEMLSRRLEFECGHEMTKGKHNVWAQAALRERGLDHIADAMDHLTKGPLKSAAFSKNNYQAAKRLGVDLPKLSMEMKFISDLPMNERAEKLSALEEKYNVQFSQGQKRSVLIITDNRGELIGNANKAAGVKGAKEVAAIARAIEDCRRLEGDQQRSNQHAPQRHEDHAATRPDGSVSADQRPDNASDGSASADRKIGSTSGEPVPREDGGTPTEPKRDTGETGSAVSSTDASNASSPSPNALSDALNQAFNEVLLNEAASKMAGLSPSELGLPMSDAPPASTGLTGEGLEAYYSFQSKLDGIAKSEQAKYRAAIDKQLAIWAKNAAASAVKNLPQNPEYSGPRM